MSDRPNVLFIMTDQMRYDCVGANGNPIIRTPSLDSLVERSATFSNAFAQAPVCVPSRMTFFTGRYPHSHRNRVNNTHLKDDEVLLPQYLREAGYNTSVVGKIHLYPPTPEEAYRVGFDTVFLHDGLPKNEPYSAYIEWRKEIDPHWEIPFKAVAEDVPPGRNPFRSALPEQYTETSWIGLQTRAELERLAEQGSPFFLFSSFFKPHHPFEVPEPFDSMYDDVEIPLPKQLTEEDIQAYPRPLRVLTLREGPKYNLDRTLLQWIYRSYYGAVSHIDREVGGILDTLVRLGCAEDTIVVFASDHGDQLYKHGIEGKNAFYEDSVHVPLTMSFPGTIAPGEYDQLVESTDVLPTLFDLLGLKEPLHCQGRSLAPLVVTGGEGYEERELVFSENIIPEVITENDWNFPFAKGKGVGGIRHPDAKMIRSKKWKLNFYVGEGGELYDLENDPGEERNLYDSPKHREIVCDLKEKLLEWMISSDETEQIAEKWLF